MRASTEQKLDKGNHIEYPLGVGSVAFYPAFGLGKSWTAVTAEDLPRIWGQWGGAPGRGKKKKPV